MQVGLLSPFDAAAILVVASALLGYANHRLLRLPASVGMTFMGAVASILFVGLDEVLPGAHMFGTLTRSWRGSTSSPHY
jgi:CPA1 family monovalent cation:H+ antiporter